MRFMIQSSIEEELPVDVAKSIQICLIRRGWSKTELAERMGVSKQIVSHWCSKPDCDGKRLAKLAQVFDMSVSDFIAEGEDND